MTQQIEFDFTLSAHEELRVLRAGIGASDNAEVIRFALRALQWLIEQLESGASIQISREGDSQEVRFTFLEWAHLGKKVPETTEKRHVA